MQTFTRRYINHIHQQNVRQLRTKSQDQERFRKELEAFCEKKKWQFANHIWNHQPNIIISSVVDVDDILSYTYYIQNIGVSWNEATPIAGWFMRENPNLKCMMAGGTPGNLHVVVSWNGGTPKSSILIAFSLINHPFWGTPIYRKVHMGDWASLTKKSNCMLWKEWLWWFNLISL